MNNDKIRKYVYWGVTAFIVLALLILLIFTMLHWGTVKQVVKMILGILAPIIYGAAFAYLLNPVYNRVKAFVETNTEKWIPSAKTRRRLGSLVGTVLSLVFLLAVVIGLIYMLIPQVISSVRGLLEVLPANITDASIRVQEWLMRMFADNPEMEQQVIEQFNAASTFLQEWMSTALLPQVYEFAKNASAWVVSALSMAMNLVIGLIVMIYLLNLKGKMLTQVVMILYGLFPVKAANKVIEEFRYVHQVFGGFIVGKIVDSAIIGVLSFVVFSVTKMPYVLLISVIIGVTNVIPFFGPFIGAVPCALLILLVDPMKCLWFCIGILIIQQLDGNVIGPMILGDSTGLSSFWVLFSILLFGGLFGFVGMIIGVPTFAVFYRLVTELVVFLLGRKQLSVDIASYEELDYIDEEKNAYIRKEK